MSWQGWEDAEILGASTWCLQTRNQGDGSVSCRMYLFTLYIWKPEKLPVGSFMDPKSHCETGLPQDSIYHLTPYVYTNSVAFRLWVSVLRVTLPKALGISGYPPAPGYLNWWTLTLEEGWHWLSCCRIHPYKTFSPGSGFWVWEVAQVWKPAEGHDFLQRWLTSVFSPNFKLLIFHFKQLPLLAAHPAPCSVSQKEEVKVWSSRGKVWEWDVCWGELR